MYTTSPTLGRSFWKRLRKIRPSKWKPKDFAKAAGVVGAGVFLGPAAAGLFAKGASAAAKYAGRASFDPSTAQTLVANANRYLKPQESLVTDAAVDSALAAGTPNKGLGVLPLVAIGAGALFLFSRKKRRG